MAFFRKELEISADGLKASTKATKSAQESAKSSSYDSSAPIVQCWNDVLSAMDVYNQKQAELIAAASNEIKDSSKEVDATRKAVRAPWAERRRSPRQPPGRSPCPRRVRPRGRSCGSLWAAAEERPRQAGQVAQGGLQRRSQGKTRIMGALQNQRGPQS